MSNHIVKMDPLTTTPISCLLLKNLIIKTKQQYGNAFYCKIVEQMCFFY